MKIKYLFLTLIFYGICSNAVFAQTFSQELVNTSKFRDSYYDIAANPNLNYVGLTELDIPNSFRESIVLISTDLNGLVQNANSYTTIDNDFSINCQQILPLQNHDLLISGTYSLNNSPPYSPFIMSVDSMGDINWAKKINLSNSSDGLFLKILSDGSILCSFRYNDGNLHNIYCKLDPSGNFSNFHECNHILTTIHNVQTNENSFELLLHDGNLLNVSNDLTNINWQRKYYSEIGITMSKASNGDYLLATAQVAFVGHMTVSRMDNSGNIIWSKYIETWLGSSSFIFDIVGFHFITETSEGNIVISANSEGGGGGSLYVTLNENGNYISNHKTTSFYNRIIPINENKMLLGGFVDIGSGNTSNFILAKIQLGDKLDCDTVYSHSIEPGNQPILEPDSIVFNPAVAFTTQDILIQKNSITISQQDYCDIIISLD